MMNEKPGDAPRPANIADPFWYLLLPLDDARRLGFVRRLAVGYYEGWHPTRAEVALLVDIELGRVSAEQLDGPLPVLFDAGLGADGTADGAAHSGDTALGHQPDMIRAVRSAATDGA